MSRRDITRDIVSIIIAVLMCLLFIVIAADDARVNRSFAEFRNQITQQRY